MHPNIKYKFYYIVMLKNVSFALWCNVYFSRFYLSSDFLCYFLFKILYFVQFLCLYMSDVCACERGAIRVPRVRRSVASLGKPEVLEPRGHVSGSEGDLWCGGSPYPLKVAGCVSTKVDSTPATTIVTASSGCILWAVGSAFADVSRRRPSRCHRCDSCWLFNFYSTIGNEEARIASSHNAVLIRHFRIIKL